MVPPQAALRVPLSKSSAMRSGGAIGWSRWQWASTPPGVTTRDDVHKRWEPIGPEFSAQRPAGAWESHDKPAVGARAVKVEERSGKRVALLEAFVGPDGMFGLCTCWFYYDEADRVVDVEWAYHSD